MDWVSDSTSVWKYCCRLYWWSPKPCVRENFELTVESKRWCRTKLVSPFRKTEKKKIVIRPTVLRKFLFCGAIYWKEKNKNHIFAFIKKCSLKVFVISWLVFPVALTCYSFIRSKAQNQNLHGTKSHIVSFAKLQIKYLSLQAHFFRCKKAHSRIHI